MYSYLRYTGLVGAPYRGSCCVTKQRSHRASRKYLSTAIACKASLMHSTRAPSLNPIHVVQSQQDFSLQTTSASTRSAICSSSKNKSAHAVWSIDRSSSTSARPQEIEVPEERLLNNEIVDGLLEEADAVLDDAPRARKRLPFIAAQLEMELAVILKSPPSANPEIQRQYLMLQYQCDAFKGVLTPLRAIPLLFGQDQSPNQQQSFNALITAFRRAYRAHSVFEIPFHQRIRPLIQNWALFGRFVLEDVNIPTEAEGDKAAQLYILALADARRSVHQLEKLLLQGGKQSREDLSRISYICLRSLCIRGRSLEGLRLYQVIIRDGIPIPPFIVGKLALALVQDGRPHEAGPLLGPLHLQKADRYTASELEAALALAAASGDHEHARYLYDLLGRRTSAVNDHHVTWLLQAYARAGRVEDAIGAFEETFRNSRVPSLVHFTPIIQATANHGTMDEVEDWLAYMKHYGHTPDIAIFNVILSSLARRGDIRSVDIALQLMASQHIPRSLATCTILVSLYASRREPELADQVVLRAIQDGLKPDARLLSALIRLHVDVDDWKGAIHIVQYLDAQSPPLFTEGELFDALLVAYVKLGAPFSASRRVFRRKMPLKGIRPSSQTYELMIQAACQANLMQVANRFFAEFNSRARKPNSGLKLDGATYATMIGGYLQGGQYRLAVGVYNAMGQSGVPTTPKVVRKVLELCTTHGRRNSLHEAEEFLGQVLSDHPGDSALLSEVTLFPLIRAYAERGRDKDVEKHVWALSKDASSVGPATLLVLLDAYRHSQNLQALRSVWKHIIKQFIGETHAYRIVKPVPQLGGRFDYILAALSIYINGLSTACAHEEVHEAWDQVTSAGIEPDATCWNSLVAALIRGGQPERAFDILEHILLPSLDVTLTGGLTMRNPPATSKPRGLPEQSIIRNRCTQGRRSTVSAPLLDSLAEPIRNQSNPHSSQNWRPSASSLAILQATLNSLQAGSTIWAVQPGPAKPILTQYDPINASIMLEKIRQNAPLAVTTVLAFDAKKG